MQRVAHVLRCRGAEVVQSRWRAGGEQVESRWRAGAEVLWSRCRGDAEEVQRRCRAAGAEVVQSMCRVIESQGAGEMHRCKGVQRCWVLRC